MPNGPILSPLRYPGGKSAIAETIATYIEREYGHNRLTYIEPFSGGAAVAIYLALNGYVQKSIINDIDKSIYAFWYSVLNHTDELCRLITDTSVNLENWELCRETHIQKDHQNLLDLGFATFFLNRTNRSGIIKGGMIGGRSQSTEYKLDCRYNKVGLIKRIEKIALHKNSFELCNLDVFDLIDQVIKPLPNSSFVYYDPPYYHKAEGLYENHFKHEDHVSLKDKIFSFNHKWVMTYDDCPEIKSIYDGYAFSGLSLNYSIAEKRKGNELFIWPK